MKKRRSLKEILQSASDVLFPEQMGTRLVELNSKDVVGDTPLHVMIWRNDQYAAKLLIESGADVNAIGDMGETPLHIALRKKNCTIVKLLIDAGANIDVRSEFGETAQELAIREGGPIKRLVTGARHKIRCQPRRST